MSILLVIIIYFVIGLAVTFVASSVDQSGQHEVNATIGILWPLSVPVLLLFEVFERVSELGDK